MAVKSDKSLSKSLSKSINKFNTDRMRSIFLCSLFGFLGVHRFYERKYISGIFYILLSLIGIIIPMVDTRSYFAIIGIILSYTFSFIDLLRLVVNKKSTDYEFIVGIILIVVSFALFMENKPTYNKKTRYVQYRENSRDIISETVSTIKI